MAKLIPFFCLLALCSFQFSSIANAQFLSPDTSTIVSESNSHNNIGSSEDSVLNENTSEEIKDALTDNIAYLLDTLGQMILTKADSQETNERDAGLISVIIGRHISEEGRVFMKAIGTIFHENANAVGNVLGSFLADCVDAFRQAQENGEDVGAAVGEVVAKSLRELDVSAQLVGNYLQQKVGDFASNVENLDAQIIKLFSYIAEGVERFIHAVAIRADMIGTTVAQVVNYATSQEGNTAVQFGRAFVGIVQAFKDKAEDISYIISETMAGYEGSTEERLTILRANVVTSIQKWNIPAEKIGSFIKNFIDAARMRAASVVEVIDSASQLLVMVFYSVRYFGL